MANEVEKSKTFTDILEEVAFTFVKDINQAQQLAINVINTIKSNKDLAECSKDSIKQCVQNALALGLSIDINQYCWFVPYKGHATLQIGYKGYIHKLTNLGAIIDTPKLIYSMEELIIESDSINGDTYVLKNRVAFPKSEDFVGVMVYIKYNGRGYVETMPKTEIDKIRECAKQDYVWQKWYGEMAKKAVIKRACKNHFAKELQELEEYDNHQYDVQTKTAGLEEINATN